MTDKATLKLDQKEIRQAIFDGDNSDGRRWLAVYPSGEYQIHWASNQRQWDPWGDDAQIIGVPALFSEGDGEEHEMAGDCLRDYGENIQEVEDCLYEENGSLIDYTEQKYPAWMKEARDNQLDFLQEAFLAACNGDGNDLNDLTPWGTTGDMMGGDLEIVEPPFQFEWK